MDELFGPDPTGRCLTLDKKDVSTLRQRNQTRGLPIAWTDGTNMNKPDLIAEEHMWEMELSVELKDHVRPFTAVLERSTLPKVKQLADSMNVTVVSATKAEIIGDILGHFRNLWEEKKDLPDFQVFAADASESLLEKDVEAEIEGASPPKFHKRIKSLPTTKDSYVQATSSASQIQDDLITVGSRLGRDSLNTGTSQGLLSPEHPSSYSRLHATSGSPDSGWGQARNCGAVTTPVPIGDKEPASQADDMEMSSPQHDSFPGVTDPGDMALASLTMSFVQHCIQTVPKRFESMQAEQTKKSVRKYMDNYREDMQDCIRNLALCEEQLTSEKEALLKAVDDSVNRIDNITRRAEETRVRATSVLNRLFKLDEL